MTAFAPFEEVLTRVVALRKTDCCAGVLSADLRVGKAVLTTGFDVSVLFVDCLTRDNALAKLCLTPPLAGELKEEEEEDAFNFAAEFGS